jgi:DNA-binding NtrC family response regulator
MVNEQRRGIPDRRKHGRGGRRPTDRTGYAPLVFVVEGDTRRRDVCEAILAKLMFAVVPLAGVRDALAALNGMRPDIVVVSHQDAIDLRNHLPTGRHGGPIPVVEFSDAEGSAEQVVDLLRDALRSTRALRD